MNQHAEVLTIGHSLWPYDRFRILLQSAGVTAVADVRSAPFSRRSPHFNRDELKGALEADGIRYHFFGRELGGRPRNSKFYCEGVADYEAMSRSRTFLDGLEQVIAAADRHRLALMCSEHNPLDCHRCLLVGRALVDRQIQVNHILGDGRQKTQVELEKEMMNEFGSESMFEMNGDILDAAYKARSKRVAYMLPHGLSQAQNKVAAE